MRGILTAVLATCVACAWLSAQVPAADALERAMTADPENLRLAADYRQLTVAAGQFDRSIAFFEKLASRKTSGPNVQISLALARVDKVPVAGEFRRLYLGRDAMASLTRSIEEQPSVLAYYVRGLINMYYNNLVFHRVSRGIDDVQRGLALVTRETPPTLAWHLHVSIGDGYWKSQQPEKAREVWRRGLALFPGTLELIRRADGDNETVGRIVSDALNPDYRVDTSLRGWLP